MNSPTNGPQGPVHVLQSQRPDYGAGTTYTCTCGAWEAWATGPTSTARVKADWRAHAGLAGHREGPIIDGDTP